MTLLSRSETPPSPTGGPSISILSRPATDPLKLVAIFTATQPGSGPRPSLMVPDRFALKGPLSVPGGELDCSPRTPSRGGRCGSA